MDILVNIYLEAFVYLFKMYFVMYDDAGHGRPPNKALSFFPLFAVF